MAKPRNTNLRARFLQGLRGAGRRIGPAVPFVAKTAVAGTAGVYLLRATGRLVQDWGDRNDPAPLSNDFYDTPEATYFRTTDGGWGATLKADYLEALALHGRTGPIILDKPLEPDQSLDKDKNAKAWDSLTDPILLLVIGAIVVAVFYVKGRK